MCTEAEAMMKLEVDLIEPLGADTVVYGRTDRDGAVRVAARLAGTTSIAEGSLPLRYAASNVHWFDSASGRRIES